MSFNFLAAITKSAVTLEPKKIKFVTVSMVFQSICSEVMGPGVMSLIFWMLSFRPIFSLPVFTYIKRLFRSPSFSAIRVLSSAYLRLSIFLQQSWFQLVLHPAQHFAGCTLHMSWISRVTIMFSFPNLESVSSSLSGSNCCSSTCIQIFQEAYKVVSYSHISLFFKIN